MGGGLGGGGRIGREIRRREQGGDGKEEVGLDGIGLRYVAVAVPLSGQMAKSLHQLILTSPSETPLLLIASESVTSQAQVIYI